MSDPTTLPPAGWYPDPYNPQLLRYWDGVWTEHVVTGSIPAPAPLPAVLPTPPPAPGPPPSRELSVVGPPVGRWGWGDVGWTALLTAGMVLIPTVGLVVWLLATGAIELDFASTGGAWLVVGLQLAMWLGLAGWPLVAARRKGPGWRKSYGVVISARAVWVGLGGGLATLFGMIALDLVVSSLIDSEITSSAAETAEQMSQVVSAYAVLLVMIALGAPFVEELAFRGLLWGAVAKRGASPWLATVVAAVPFAVIHFEPLRMLSLVYAGLLLGVLRHFGGLGASMLAHATVNSISVVLLLLTT